jgi:integrase
MALTKLQIENAKPREKAYKLGDSGGLFLYVHPNSGRYWRFKYRYLGKEKTLSLGVYPDLSLADARSKRDAARRELHVHERDPGEEKKKRRHEAILKDRTTFECIAREWLERQEQWSAYYTKQVTQRLEKDVFPKLGARPIAAITPQEVLRMAKGIQERGAYDMGHRAIQICSQVYQGAVIEGLVERNPCHDLRGVLKTRKTKHREFLEERELPAFFEKLEKYGGHNETVIGMKLLILTAVRSGELRNAEWTEFDFDKKLWTIPAEKMKMGKTHLVPLSRQAILLLKMLKQINGHRKLLLSSPSNPSQPISNNTFNSAMHAMGYKGKAQPHGFRSTASTILNETSKFDPQAIERQLAHQPANKVKRAYDRSEFLEERTKMMNWYGHHMEALGLQT